MEDGVAKAKGDDPLFLTQQPIRELLKRPAPSSAIYMNQYSLLSCLSQETAQSRVAVHGLVNPLAGQVPTLDHDLSSLDLASKRFPKQIKLRIRMLQYSFVSWLSHI